MLLYHLSVMCVWLFIKKSNAVSTPADPPDSTAVNTLVASCFRMPEVGLIDLAKYLNEQSILGKMSARFGFQLYHFEKMLLTVLKCPRCQCIPTRQES